MMGEELNGIEITDRGLHGRASALVDRSNGKIAPLGYYPARGLSPIS